MQDPYRVLGILPTASDDEVKKAYRALAKKWHPDANGGAPEAEARMKEINEAYATIMRMRREGTSWSGGAHAGTGGYQSSGGDAHLQAARNYIAARHFREALNVLSGIQTRGAEWYFLSAVANEGVGNRIAAMNDAQHAVNMDPNNFEYRAFLSRLQGGGTYYQQQGVNQGFGTASGLCGNPVMSCCAVQILLNLLCNCCCRFGRGC